MSTVSRADQIAWGKNTTGEYKLIHSQEEAVQGMKKVLDEGAYLDLHAWCFVPHSFRLIVHDLHALGLCPFQEVGFFPTRGCEFFVTLGRNGTGSGKTRLELLAALDAELENPERQMPRSVRYVRHLAAPVARPVLRFLRGNRRG